ncbi:hypothetical protein JOF41_006613 [Saccharothrix coeruleofusca]|uniref:hypothetical protein n=1 Tax=Saccharothrix coeruleofusca TaxID=33919 RepID=UPI001AEA298D|nr:hypothetical protein [Saccharothrix coeruleofusca]MBP2340435.1 hypothetical protein [Saccharothrix coeruleofusca]
MRTDGSSAARLGDELTVMFVAVVVVVVVTTSEVFGGDVAGRGARVVAMVVGRPWKSSGGPSTKDCDGPGPGSTRVFPGGRGPGAVSAKPMANPASTVIATQEMTGSGGRHGWQG